MSTMSAELSTHGAAGARIAAELRYGASRVPVREALRMLEAEGLVTLVANTGAWVSTVSLTECEEMYQMRERIEPLLLRYNIPLLSDAQIGELETLAMAMEHTDDVERFLVLDREFHLACYTAAETTVLGDTVLRLWNRTQHYRRAYTRLFRSEGDRSVHHEHHLLVSAIRRRDLDEAERVLAGHIRRTRLELARHPDVFE
jgi:DNA-binding GntR family transcriptional regulator